MKKKILIFVHTEYHLIIAVNQLLKQFYNEELYDVQLFLDISGKKKRLKQHFDFSILRAKVAYWEYEVTINSALSSISRSAIMSIISNPPDVFIFFQEQNPLMVILSCELSHRGTQVHLYQDGLKPYINLNYHSLSLLIGDHKQNLWLKRNGFKVRNWLSPIVSKKYAFLKGISKVFLTFPEKYSNWNNKLIEKIEIESINKLKPIIEKLFNWDRSILPENNNVILYMSQPMHYDGTAELLFLTQLSNKFPQKKIIIKLHPSTSKTQIEHFNKLENTTVIDSMIPAEIFIMNLQNSIILSIISTSMFINNPENEFFYIYRLFEEEIKRLKRWRVTNPTPHIKIINSIEDIHF